MKTFRFFGLLTLLYCFVACSKGNESDEPNPTPSVPTITIDNSIITNGLSFTDGAGDESITFAVDTDWTLSVAETRAVEWCTPSATSGVKGTATVTFSVTENTGYDNRKAAVTIKAGSTSKTFTISQKQKDALLITTDKYELEQVGGEIEVEVKANIDYQIEIAESAKSWISENTTRALTTKKHAFTIAASEEYEKREGEIYVKSGDKQETIKIYQSGGTILLLSQNEYVVSDAGETITIDIKSNFEYGVQLPDVDWISEVTDTRAASSHTLKYDIAPNETYDNRSAEIIFFDKNSDLKEIVKIEQVQKDAIILSASEYTIPSEGETIEVALQSNVSFEVSINADWITQVDAPSTRSLEEHKLYFKVDENTLEEGRSASITITDTDKCISQVIEVTQEKACEKVAQMIDGPTFNQTLKELSGDLANIQSIDFIINDGTKPTTDYVLLSTSDSYYPIYATYNNGGVKVFTAGDRFVLNTNCSKMFYDFYHLISLELSSFDTSNVTNMNSMFSGCSVACLDLSSFDTSNVTDMKTMFSSCQNLTSLDLSNFDTSSVISMCAMFVSCSKITSLDLSSFNTTNVIDMVNMFGYCQNLQSLDLSSFDTSNVANMQMMFYVCPSLTSLDLSSFDTSNVKDMGFMFVNCSKLASLNISSFNTANIANMSGMFSGCSSLTSLDVTNFNTSNVADMSGMFSECSSLTSLDVTNFNTSNVTDMSGMFSGCSSLTSLDVTSFNTSKVMDMSSMFDVCWELSSLNLSNFSTSNVTNMNSMFGDCFSLTSLDLRNFDTTNVKDMSRMFYVCSSLTSLDLSNFNTSNVMNMNDMFYECRTLTFLDLNFNTANITNMDGMFSGCNELTSLDLRSFDTSNVTNMRAMFSGCKSLASLDISNFIIKPTTMTIDMFWGTASSSKDCTITILDESYQWVKEQLNAPYFNIILLGESNSKEKVALLLDGPTINIALRVVSGDLENIKSIEFVVNDNTEPIDNYNLLSTSNSYYPIYATYNNGNVRIFTEGDSIVFMPDCSNMFQNLRNVTSIKFGHCINTSYVTDMSGMFCTCWNLNSLDLSSFNTTNVKNMSNMFNGCNVSSLDLSGFDTSNVTDMSSMFSGCSALTSLDLRGFSTSNVIYMNNMFWYCTSLTSVDLSSFNTSNVTYMNGMFLFCNVLSSLDLRSFVFNTTTDVSSMFMSLGSLVVSKPVPIYVTQAAFEYLTNPNIYTGITSSDAKFVDENGNDYLVSY